MTATGTIYGLIDPRDGKMRYVGQTKQRVAVRIRGTYAPRVRAWMTELLDAGLTPLSVALRENVPVADLLAVEAEEITRIIAEGGALLNEQVTARGREMLRQRQEAEQKAAERAGWSELADAALATLGGPLPPGDLPDGAWRGVRLLGGDLYDKWQDRNISLAEEIPYASRADAARCRGLIMWYMIAVDPWWHLAEIAGRPQDDASFVAWAGRDAAVREALEFLATHGEGILARLAADWKGWRWTWQVPGPGRMLATVAAAYTDVEPADAIRDGVADVLRKTAEDHMLTRPMADLLERLDPKALDTVFGKDIAADLDRDLGLPDGTSGRVLRELADRLNLHPRDTVRRAADRSAQALPLAPLPDYWRWSGPVVPGARVASASLVRAGLAAPDHMSAEEYLATVRDLWTPRPDERQRQEAA